MTREAAPATITAEGLGHDYEDLTAISGLDLSVAAGRTQAIVGPSGCGKSTLLEILSGLSGPSRGTVEVAGETSLVGRLEKSAFMPQRDCLLPWYSAIDNAGLALLNQGRSRKEARAAAHEHWLYALCVIAWRLNGRERARHIGRRRLIARVRF